MFSFTYICEKEFSSVILGLGGTCPWCQKEAYRRHDINNQKADKLLYVNGKLLAVYCSCWIMNNVLVPNKTAYLFKSIKVHILITKALSFDNLCPIGCLCSEMFGSFQRERQKILTNCLSNLFRLKFNPPTFNTILNIGFLCSL